MQDKLGQCSRFVNKALNVKLSYLLSKVVPSRHHLNVKRTAMLICRPIHQEGNELISCKRNSKADDYPQFICAHPFTPNLWIIPNLCKALPALRCVSYCLVKVRHEVFFFSPHCYKEEWFIRIANT